MTELPPFRLDATAGYDAFYTPNNQLSALAYQDVQDFGYPAARDQTLGWELPVAQPQGTQLPLGLDPALGSGWPLPEIPQMQEQPEAVEAMDFDRFSIPNLDLDAIWAAGNNVPALPYVLPPAGIPQYQGGAIILPQLTVPVPLLPARGVVAYQPTISAPQAQAVADAPQPTGSTSAKKTRKKKTVSWQKLIHLKQRVTLDFAQRMYEESVAVDPNNNVCPFRECGWVSDGPRQRRAHRRHVMSHAHLKGYQCPHCGKSKSRGDALSMHIRRDCPNRPANAGA